MSTERETKTCVACGRPFANRKKWRSRGVWDQVIYCSKRCQGAGRNPEAGPGGGAPPAGRG